MILGACYVGSKFLNSTMFPNNYNFDNMYTVEKETPNPVSLAVLFYMVGGKLIE